MTDLHDTHSSSTAREQELEVEVARLQAELDTLRGDDPSLVTSRFLSMAAATVDQAVADARREADEIVEEVSAQAEARRDEATRVAAEAEALAEQKLEEADRAQEAVDAATEQAESIKAAATKEAAAHVAIERQKVAAELEAFAAVRAALDEERVALETYHEKLRKGVQDLAQSMVSFMGTELPDGSISAIDDLVSPQLEAALSDLDSSFSVHTASTEISDTDADETDETVAVDELDDVDPLDTPAPVAEVEAPVAADPWTAMLESAIPEHDRIVDVPDTAIGEIPAGPTSFFGGAPIVEDPAATTSAGLFSRAAADDTDDTDDTVRAGDDVTATATATAGDDDTADGSDDETADTGAEDAKSGRGGLFGMLGARLVQQTSPDDRADVVDTDDTLDTEDSDDQAFRQFLDGDDAPDPSRDWLLRPEAR
ncbi:MAG: hypothetical protein RIB98_12350 [Acidimicrobiales bacterium]